MSESNSTIGDELLDEETCNHSFVTPDGGLWKAVALGECPWCEIERLRHEMELIRRETRGSPWESGRTVYGIASRCLTRNLPAVSEGRSDG